MEDNNLGSWSRCVAAPLAYTCGNYKGDGDGPGSTTIGAAAADFAVVLTLILSSHGVPTSLDTLQHIQDGTVPACNRGFTPSPRIVYGPRR